MVKFLIAFDAAPKRYASRSEERPQFPEGSQRETIDLARS
jgi:hypothetical protein